MAETVVMTCALKVRSETSRLFLAMRIWRELRAGPKPCSKCCVTLSASDELVEGLNWARMLLVSELLLVSPRLTSVPVSKFCCAPTAEVTWRWTREFVPVGNELLCGAVRCASPPHAGIAAVIHQRLPVHHFGADELLFEIGVDGAGRFHRGRMHRDG